MFEARAVFTEKEIETYKAVRNNFADLTLGEIENFFSRYMTFANSAT